MSVLPEKYPENLEENSYWNPCAISGLFCHHLAYQVMPEKAANSAGITLPVNASTWGSIDR